MSGSSRPFKVWSSDRSSKKSVTASTLEDLKAKGKGKLGVPAEEKVNVVLEEDGTEVDEEDYFTFLPFNTTVMILRHEETWRPPGAERGKDEPDAMIGDGQQISDRVKQLARGLHHDIARIITFSNEDLHEMVSVSPVYLAQLLCDTETYATVVQEACQRHLDEREQATEAMDLLKLYQKAREQSPYVGDDDPKRKRKKEADS